MDGPLTREEINRLRGLLDCASEGDLRRLSSFATGLSLGVGNPAAALNAGSRMSEMVGLSYHGGTLQKLSAYERQLSDIANILGPFTQRLADLAKENPPESTIRIDVQNEIGALKAELGQTISAINASMASVQSVVDALREEHELISVTRHLETDPEWGKFA